MYVNFSETENDLINLSCRWLQPPIGYGMGSDTSLSFDGCPDEREEEEAQEDQVAPPDDWVAEQVDPLVVAGKELALKIKQGN